MECFHDLGVYVYAPVYAWVDSCAVCEVAAIAVVKTLLEGGETFFVDLAAEVFFDDETYGEVFASLPVVIVVQMLDDLLDEGIGGVCLGGSTLGEDIGGMEIAEGGSPLFVVGLAMLDLLG